jgi:hypothetical protein
MNASSIRVAEIRSPVVAENLPRANARLGWRSPLKTPELEAIARWASAKGGASIRLHGAAIDQLDAVLEIVPVVRLEVDAARLVRPPKGAGEVRELSLHGLPDRAQETISAFVGVHTLRIDARGAAFDVRALYAMPVLRGVSIAAASLHGCSGIDRVGALAALELVRTRVDELDSILRHPELAALRLSNVERVTSIDALRGHAGLRSLALESLLHLESLAPIATLHRLETLAIGGLWQFNVADAAFIAEMKTLRALSLDLGGTRKNVEITKLLRLPEASPFDVGAYDLTTS